MQEKKEFRFDMDGVLADFDLHFLNLFGMSPTEMEEKHGSRYFWAQLTQAKNFYKDLPLTPYARDLVAEAKALFGKTHNFSILTAIPRSTTYPTAMEEKIWWEQNVLAEGFVVNFGPYSKSKQNWAKPGDILLDDRASNIDEWNAKGGTGILHIYGDLDDTLVKMKKVMESIHA